jgi:hypothetical protein
MMFFLLLPAQPLFPKDRKYPSLNERSKTLDAPRKQKEEEEEKEAVTRDRQPPCIQIQRTSPLSLSLSLRVFRNSCCSNTAPEFTLVAAASPSSIMAQQHHPKTKIAQKNKKKWKQISTLTSKFTYSFQLGSKVELLLPLLELVLLTSSSSSSSSAMDSSSITNTNKRRQQQQQQQQSTTKEEQIPPCTNKQTQQKNFSFFAKIASFAPTPNSHTQFIFLGATISFAELQVLHQHNCMNFFWSNNNKFTSISHVPNWKFVGTTKYQQNSLLPKLGNLSYYQPTKVLLCFFMLATLFLAHVATLLASPRGNWECSHLLPPLPKHFMVHDAFTLVVKPVLKK